MKQNIERCPWALVSAADQDYHDKEWGVPVYSDQQLFENLTLEGAQAGLSWSTILKKREGYRNAFANFDIQTVASFDQNKIDALINNPDIVRHRLKITSTINNANRIIDIQKTHGSFATFIWQFVEHTPIVNNWQSASAVPSETPISQSMSRVLKKHGFSFVGSKICYAFMQASGLVDDHLIHCICRQKVCTSPKRTRLKT